MLHSILDEIGTLSPSPDNNSESIVGENPGSIIGNPVIGLGVIELYYTILENINRTLSENLDQNLNALSPIQLHGLLSQLRLLITVHEVGFGSFSRYLNEAENLNDFPAYFDMEDAFEH